MSELISGKEALIALANGGEVEFKSLAGDWRNLEIDELLGHLELRLKPRTITINGIEVPRVKYVAHSGGNCVKISCKCPEDAALINSALRSIFK